VCTACRRSIVEGKGTSVTFSVQPQVRDIAYISGGSYCTTVSGGFHHVAFCAHVRHRRQLSSHESREKRKHKSKRSRHDKSALPNGSRRHASRRSQVCDPDDAILSLTLKLNSILSPTAALSPRVAVQHHQSAAALCHREGVLSHVHGRKLSGMHKLRLSSRR